MREGGWQAEGGPRGGIRGAARAWHPALGTGQRRGGARATERRVRAGRSGLAVGVTLRGLEVTKEPASQDEPLGHETGAPGEPPHRPRPAGVPAPWRPSSLETATRRGITSPARGSRGPRVQSPGQLQGPALHGHEAGPPWGTGWGRARLGSGVSGKPRVRSARAPPPAPAPARLPHHEAWPAALHPANPETHSGRSPSR